MTLAFHGSAFARTGGNSSDRTHLVYGTKRTIALVLTALVVGASRAHAQARVGSDSATRLTRFGRDLLYGTAEGLAFSGVDQLRTDPPEWGKGWRGYEKRVASNVGEFLIQETVTEGLAAAMDRPLDYKRCRCKKFDDRLVHAARGALFDEMRDGSHELAIPRIVGAYTGSFAQAAWRPKTANSVLRVGLVNGTTSLAIGGLINLYHEVHR
jgi:hypothetical protein